MISWPKSTAGRRVAIGAGLGAVAFCTFAFLHAAFTYMSWWCLPAIGLMAMLVWIIIQECRNDP